MHGSGGHAEAYVRNLAAHAEHFWTWSIDMLGHGYTDKPGHPLEVGHYVEHLMAVLGAIGVDRACLSGESLGGWVAARAAVDHPDVVDRLVLNTAGGSQADPGGDAADHHAVHGGRRGPDVGDRSGADQMADGRQVQGLRRSGRQPATGLSPTGIRRRPCATSWRCRIRRSGPATSSGPDEYGSITAPTLVLWTSDDPTADVTEGRRIASMIPGARFEVMPGCGHWPQYEDAKTFNRLHLDFLLGR